MCTTWEQTEQQGPLVAPMQPHSVVLVGAAGSHGGAPSSFCCGPFWDGCVGSFQVSLPGAIITRT